MIDFMGKSVTIEIFFVGPEDVPPQLRPRLLGKESKPEWI
jgi:hypothetical protein